MRKERGSARRIRRKQQPRVVKEEKHLQRKAVRVLPLLKEHQLQTRKITKFRFLIQKQKII